MSVIDRRLLVTTALESTWGNDENLLFAGAWCKLYERRHVWEERNHETNPFHWDDRRKLNKDYDYLEELHHTLLHCLTASLNSLHKVNYSLRCWQILLDPWLMAYVGVLFDRWETLRTVFENYKSLVTILPEEPGSAEIPFSYNEYHSQTLSDEWNFLLFSRIIESSYLDKCTIERSSSLFQHPRKSTATISRRTGKVFEKVSTLVDSFLGWFGTNYKVVFLSSGFNLLSFVMLSVAIRQVPRLFLKDFKFFDAKGEVKSSLVDRGGLSLNFEPKNDFEAFLKKSIIADIPLSVVEGFETLRDRAAGLKIKTKAIVTANDHWGNIFAKYWFCDQVSKGVKLVILEHGGSLPAYRELFHFEEDIADVRGTWFLPYHEKHVKLPPTKLAKMFAENNMFKKKPIRKFCSLIGNEQPRWVFRAHFYPMAAQCLVSFEWSVVLYDALNENVKENFKVRPYSNMGWNTKAMFEDAIGAENIASGGKIDDAFRVSKIIICTYPETTFSEAMATGIPVILVYPEQYYERNSVADALLDVMCAAKMVFFDPLAAAEHVNCIWDDPEKWWNSSDVLRARAEFTRQAISIEGNWLGAWKDFLNRTIQ